MVFTGVQSAELWTKSGSSYLLATSWSARCRSHIFEASHKRRHTSISDFCKTWPGAAKAKHSSLAAERDILSCNMQGAKNGCGWQTWRNEQGLANGNAEQVHPNLSYARYRRQAGSVDQCHTLHRPRIASLASVPHIASPTRPSGFPSRAFPRPQRMANVTTHDTATWRRHLPRDLDQPRFRPSVPSPQPPLTLRMKRV